MRVSELKDRANREWSRSPELRHQYHTFEYYWWERYARVYHLPTRIRIAR